MDIKSPCKDCKDRYCGCHDKCERYQNACALRKKEKDAILKARQKEYIISSTIGAGLSRMSKLKRTNAMRSDII